MGRQAGGRSAKLMHASYMMGFPVCRMLFSGHCPSPVSHQILSTDGLPVTKTGTGLKCECHVNLSTCPPHPTPHTAHSLFPAQSVNNQLCPSSLLPPPPHTHTHHLLPAGLPATHHHLVPARPGWPVFCRPGLRWRPLGLHVRLGLWGGGQGRYRFWSRGRGR